MLKGWMEKTLGECCIGRPTYGANAPSVDYDTSLPRYLRITDISEDGNLIASDPRSITTKDAEGNYLNKGDIVFARSGATAGKTYLHQSNDILAYAGYLIRFRLDPNIILPEYLFLYTQSDHYKIWVKNNIRAGAQPNINAQEYSSISILLPPLAEQKKIAAILNVWGDAIEKTGMLIAKKENLFRWLQITLIFCKSDNNEWNKKIS